MGVAGRLVQTSGIVRYPSTINRRSARKWKPSFTPDNDPHGEGDFRAFEHNGKRIFWKIDYYDSTMMKGSEDPSDPGRTVRILTIMFASELLIRQRGANRSPVVPPLNYRCFRALNAEFALSHLVC